MGNKIFISIGVVVLFGAAATVMVFSKKNEETALNTNTQKIYNQNDSRSLSATDSAITETNTVIQSAGKIEYKLGADETFSVSKFAANTGDAVSIKTSSASSLGALGLTIDSIEDGVADSVSGLNIVWTESDDYDVWTALNLPGITSSNSLTRALVVGEGYDTILDSGTIDISGDGSITGATRISTDRLTVSSPIHANAGIQFNDSSDTISAFTLDGKLNADNNILTNIGNSGTDFIASSGGLTLAGVLTANGGINLTASQSLSAAALSYLDFGLITHGTTANQGLRLPNASSATPSNPTSGEGYLAWDASGNQLIVYNGSSWDTVGGGVGSSDLQTAYDADTNGSNATISLTAADDGLVITNPSSGGNDLSNFVLQLTQQNTTATATVLDLVQSSNAANGVNLTANSIDGETGLSITANGLTSGSAFTATSTATAFTGNLAGITLSGSNAANTGNVFAVSNTGAANTNTSLFVDHRATGTNNLAVRVDDEASDATPFVIDGSGNVGVGTTSPSRIMDIFQAASAPQLRLSKDLTNYSEFTVDSAGDLLMGATGTDIRALSENLWVCDNDACPALTLTGDGNIFIENTLKFGNGVYIKNDAATELGVYDNDGNLMMVFDEL